MNRSSRKEVALQTIKIQDDGFYEVKGKRVSISEGLKLAMENTETFSPDVTFHINKEEKGLKETEVEITNESTLQCAKRLYESKKYEKIGILNFASAKNPGGGFLGGSQAQEESIARSSGLYYCIKDSEMYEYNRQHRNLLYSDYMQFSPRVPIFRNDIDNNELLETPYYVDVITCPAPNAKAYMNRGGDAGELEQALTRRIDRILRCAIHNELNAIVLGAFGCGVFGNRIDTVATLFKKFIDGKYKGYFDYVCYAIYGKSFEVFGECYETGRKQFMIGKTKKKGKRRKMEKGGKGGWKKKYNWKEEEPNKMRKYKSKKKN